MASTLPSGKWTPRGEAQPQRLLLRGWRGRNTPCTSPLDDDLGADAFRSRLYLRKSAQKAASRTTGPPAQIGGLLQRAARVLAGTHQIGLAADRARGPGGRAVRSRPWPARATMRSEPVSTTVFPANGPRDSTHRAPDGSPRREGRPHRSRLRGLGEVGIMLRPTQARRPARPAARRGSRASSRSMIEVSASARAVPRRHAGCPARR